MLATAYLGLMSVREYLVSSSFFFTLPSPFSLEKFPTFSDAFLRKSWFSIDWFACKDQALPAHRPRGVAEGLPLTSVLLAWEEQAVRRAGPCGNHSPLMLPGGAEISPKHKRHWELGGLLQNAARLISIHSCCGASTVPRVSTAGASQVFSA